MLAMVAIMAAMLDMLEPRLIVSAMLILRVSFEGTTISQPGSTLARSCVRSARSRQGRKDRRLLDPGTN